VEESKIAGKKPAKSLESVRFLARIFFPTGKKSGVPDLNEEI